MKIIKNYELMARLEKLPSGAEIVCSGLKTVDEIEESEPMGKDEYGIDQYQVTEDIVDVNLEENHIYLQF